MRQESNNGIDLLLRQLGRREDSFSSELDAQHLDADELSSYVANALPSAARARYTAHLADCSSCRKMVAQLSAAEGVVAARQPASVVAPSGLKSFLASLFSPLVLRYAIPALGVIVIAVVGIVVLRQERARNSIAQLTNADQKETVVQSPAAGATPRQGLHDGRLTDQAAADKAAEQNNEVPKAGASAPAAKDAPRDTRDTSSSDTAGAAPAAPVQQTQPVTTASEPPPPSPAKAAPAEESERQAEPEKKKVEINRTDVIAAQRSYDRAKKEADDNAAAPASGSGNKVSGPQRGRMNEGTGTGAVANAPQSRDEYKRLRKGETNVDTLSSGEKRTVAGREFHKRGNVWIDIDYKSSQATTIIARGSEQYRSLVEDEPQIHTIAETFKTEFVVVWKGRAYRVR